MYPNYLISSFQNTKSSQQGSMLVIALFVIIVFALLGLTITRVLSSSSNTVIHEVLGQRALNAAKAGIECAIADKFGEGCINPTEKIFTGVEGLENCSYTATVTPENGKSIVDGSQSFTYWTFTSKGQCRAGKINVTRFVYVDAIE